MDFVLLMQFDNSVAYVLTVSLQTNHLHEDLKGRAFRLY